MERKERIVVVGAGLAGLQSVQALREQGYTGTITLLGAERHRPYDRPPLSKELLAGEVDDTTLPAEWNELDCELLLGRRAVKLRPGSVDTDAGAFDFDGLVIATGATPIRLPGDGPQRTLRTVDDARSLREALRPGARIAIVGAGWIGAEVATAAARAGCRVTVVEAGPAPLCGSLGVVGAIIGSRTETWYYEAGIELMLNTSVAAVVDGGLSLADGEFLPADEVLTAVGVRPEVGWLGGSDVRADGAVFTDERLRTNVAGVYAVGDCAAWWSPRFQARLRVEHWDNALRAPAAAAAGLLRELRGGEPSAAASDAGGYDPVPYFWSAQHGRMLQYAGHHRDSDDLVWRGDPDGEDRDWSVCWLRGDILVAILVVNRPRDLMQARRIITAGAPVDRDLLADPATPLKQAKL